MFNFLGDGRMIIQDLIYKIGKWLYSGEITAFDEERKELNKGKQFPDEKVVLERLDSIMSNFDGNKISLGTDVTEQDLVGVGADKDDSID